MKALLALCLAAVLAGPAVASDSRSLDAGGRSRSYLVHRPAALARSAKVPLVIMLHGGLGSGTQAEGTYGWNEEADARGFVVAYPDGLWRTWNAGGVCCGRANHEGVDDVAFLDRLIDTVARDENIDTARIYLTGMSNGGAMAYRYACEGHHKLAALGPVATSFTFACPKVSPVPVMAVHGLIDETVPFAGGPGRRVKDVHWLPVQSSLDVFRDADRCGAPALAQQGVVTTATAHCEKGREVVLVTVADAGHQWPGSVRERGLGARLLHLDAPSEAFETTAKMWSFFSRYSASGD